MPTVRSKWGAVQQAGSSDAGKDLAARTAEVVFTVQSNIDTAKAFYHDLKQKVAAFGRDPDQVKILPGLMAIVGATHEEAQAKYEELQSLILPVVGMSLLEGLAGRTVKLSDYPLDGPLPELPPTSYQKSRQAVVLEMARKENLTIRELYLRLAGSRGHLTVVGTAQDVADEMQAWFESRAADGFNVMPATIPGGLDDFSLSVIPELQRRGLFRDEYDGSTLRDHLGLSYPVCQNGLSRLSA